MTSTVKPVVATVTQALPPKTIETVTQPKVTTTTTAPVKTVTPVTTAVTTKTNDTTKITTNTTIAKAIQPVLSNEPAASGAMLVPSQSASPGSETQTSTGTEKSGLLKRQLHG